MTSPRWGGGLPGHEVISPDWMNVDAEASEIQTR
jgi:hypothetical protein